MLDPKRPIMNFLATLQRQATAKPSLLVQHLIPLSFQIRCFASAQTGGPIGTSLAGVALPRWYGLAIGPKASGRTALGAVFRGFGGWLGRWLVPLALAGRLVARLVFGGGAHGGAGRCGGPGQARRALCRCAAVPPMAAALPPHLHTRHTGIPGTPAHRHRSMILLLFLSDRPRLGFLLSDRPRLGFLHANRPCFLLTGFLRWTIALPSLLELPPIISLA